MRLSSAGLLRIDFPGCTVIVDSGRRAGQGMRVLDVVVIRISLGCSALNKIDDIDTTVLKKNTIAVAVERLEAWARFFITFC